MMKFFRKLRRDDRGISALEYALLAGTILVVIGGTLASTDISGSLESIFGSVGSQLSDAASNGSSN